MGSLENTKINCLFSESKELSPGQGWTGEETSETTTSNVASYISSLETRLVRNVV